MRGCCSYHERLGSSFSVQLQCQQPDPTVSRWFRCSSPIHVASIWTVPVVGEVLQPGSGWPKNMYGSCFFRSRLMQQNMVSLNVYAGRTDVIAGSTSVQLSTSVGFLAAASLVCCCFTALLAQTSGLLQNVGVGGVTLVRIKGQALMSTSAG